MKKLLTLCILAVISFPIFSYGASVSTSKPPKVNIRQRLVLAKSGSIAHTPIINTGSTNSGNLLWTGSINNTWSISSGNILIIDMLSVMKQNEQSAANNSRFQSEQEENWKRIQAERDKLAEQQKKDRDAYIASLPWHSQSVTPSTWWSSSNQGWYTCYTWPRWGRYHYSSSWTKVYSWCD